MQMLRIGKCLRGWGAMVREPFIETGWSPTRKVNQDLGGHMDTVDYKDALRRGRRLLAVMAVVGLLAGVALAVLTTPPPQWETTTIIAVPPGQTTTGPQSTPLQYSFTVNELLFYSSVPQMYQAVAQLADPSKQWWQLEQMITVTGPVTSPNGEIISGQPGAITVTVKAPTPQLSANINNIFGQYLQGGLEAVVKSTLAQISSAIDNIRNELSSIQNPAIANALSAQLDSLYSQQTQLTPLLNLNSTTGFFVQTTNAVLAKRVSPTLATMLAEEGAGGLALGVVLAGVLLIVAAAFDKRIRTARQAEASFGHPVVVEIPDVTAPSVEPYRMLRLSILFEPLPEPIQPDYDWTSLLDPDAERVSSGNMLPVPAGQRGRQVEHPAIGDRKVVLIVSPESEGTRPYIAARLATVCAEAGQRVAVVSTVGLGTSPPTGPLAIAPRIQASDVASLLETSTVKNVFKLSLQPFGTNPSHIVSRAPMVLNALRSLVDVVIVEVPSFVSVHHGEGLAKAADVVLMVGECHTTQLAQAQRTGRQLRKFGAPVLGVVLTNTIHVHRFDIGMFRRGGAAEVARLLMGTGPAPQPNGARSASGAGKQAASSVSTPPGAGPVPHYGAPAAPQGNPSQGTGWSAQPSPWREEDLRPTSRR